MLLEGVKFPQNLDGLTLAHCTNFQIKNFAIKVIQDLLFVKNCYVLGQIDKLLRLTIFYV
jgi:hypothetical protein